MTQQRTLELSCPGCESKQSVTVYDTVNVSLDPSLKEKLFNGQINVFQCERCKEKAFISLPLLYHDMEMNFMVQFYPFDSTDDKEFLRLFSKDGQMLQMEELRLPRKMKDRYRKIQIVFDMRELIRYVIFREALYEIWKEAS